MIYLHKYVKVYQHHTSLQPLMRRFQAALKDYLTKQMEEVNLDLRELVCGILSLPSTAAHPCPRCQPISAVFAEDSHEAGQRAEGRAGGGSVRRAAAAGAAADGPAPEPRALRPGGRGAAAPGGGAGGRQAHLQENVAGHR